MTGVTPLILPADIRDQCLGALHLDFEGGNQCIFRVHNDVARFILQLNERLVDLMHCQKYGFGRLGKSPDCRLFWYRLSPAGR
jgi:hypothetical protein